MHRKSALAYGLVMSFLALDQNCVMAQPVTGAPFNRPIDETLETPDYTAPAEPPILQLPPVPAPAPDAPLSRQMRLYVDEIRLQGNTVFTDAELAELTKAYVDRYVTAGELETLRQALTLYYVNRGFINSGVLIPDQKIVDGVINLSIVEGKLVDIQSRGLVRLREDYVNSRLFRGVDKPLNMEALSTALQLLQQNPRIERLGAALLPGTAPGAAVLDVQVEEAPPFHLWAGVNNTRPPAVGAEQGTVRGVHRNLTGRGDSLGFGFNVTDGLESYDVSYAVPLTAADTEVNFRFSRNDSAVIERPFNSLDIESHERSYGIGLVHPVYRTLNRTLMLTADIERRESRTSLGGIPFNFSEAAENGETKIWVLRFAQEWRNRQKRNALAARSTFSLGIDAFDATVNGKDGDGRFFAWIGQLQMAHRLGKESQVILRSALQLADNPLPSLEQFSAGGLDTVRGYRENQLVTDQGLIASIEFRLPFWKSKDGRSTLQLAPFYDYAAVRNRNRPTPGVRDLSAAGIGLRWHHADLIDAVVYFARPFRNIDTPSGDLQDDGIHFTITAKLR